VTTGSAQFLNERYVLLASTDNLALCNTVEETGHAMGLNIVLTDCNGEPMESIDDPKNFLHKLLPPADEASDSVLAKIDWYGDTYLNYLQIKRFLEEWDQLEQRAESSEEKALIVALRRLAVRCQNDRGLLRFIGD
jgi:hypothetical protein